MMATSRNLRSYIAAGIGVGSVVILSVKPSRTKIQWMFEQLREKIERTRKKNIPMEKTGHPDPYDVKDNEMVSEGALYAVDYYNRKEQ
ncbi:hypothetical protein SM124_17430 [Bacillus sp. 31A1R]|uniref:Uncharacterized protein n=1 Tax=Robertmurraya mangrovi TaxID=3098077 RepID=A0ABU5J276_9BACI|nr:hypothetical protein [Bacillus sp. 31A1R]MDZ5473499.1 hypothetical protein [Bacillus sp. 31A1R]